MKHLLFVGLAAACAISSADLSAGQKIAIRVSPAVALAPAVLTVRTTVEPNDDNRLLSVEIDSPTYQRISELPLDGRNAQRTNILELRDVPAGLYEVRAEILGLGGSLGRTMQLVKVEPAAGRSR
jgi:hypothetical protein